MYRSESLHGCVTEVFLFLSPGPVQGTVSLIYELIRKSNRATIKFKLQKN